VYGVETFGSASVGMLALYVMQYVVKAPNLTELFVAVYFVPQFAFTPVWVRLARRFSKKNLWLFSMCLLVVGYGCMFFISEGAYVLIFSTVFFMGLGGGCGAVVAPSIQADVVDYDEYLTGERKEGAYVAIWNLIRKSGAGLTALLSGIVLQWVGYEPNVEQSESTKTAMLALMGLLPAVCYAAGALLFTRFRFNEKEHAEVVAILAERKASALASQARDQ
jgi:GPH family glycoside/pentoside/hexuronide:cation symporter